MKISIQQRGHENKLLSVRLEISRHKLLAITDALAFYVEHTKSVVASDCLDFFLDALEESGIKR